MNRSDKENAKFKILVVSNADIGTEVGTYFLHELTSEEIYHYALGKSECDECSCLDTPDDTCEVCDTYGYYEDSYLFMCTLYSGTNRQFREAANDTSHSSHFLSDNCDEICLGDYV